MASALVGSTGFVGGELRLQTTFDDHFHSTDIESIRGRSYDLLVCAGAPAEKWRANKEPEKDRENLARLMANLSAVTARQAILISTVDVYPSPAGVDEDTPVDSSGGSAYGRHRYELERFFVERFPTIVLRLPGLFGRGLKKNIIYDFLHGNALDAICPASVYQFYPLGRLWSDIGLARRHGLALVNLATEPVSVRDVAREAFGTDFVNPKQANAARYDQRTKHAALFGGRGHYLMDRRQVLDAIRDFVASQRTA